jgi:hypothetical protein
MYILKSKNPDKFEFGISCADPLVGNLQSKRLADAMALFICSASQTSLDLGLATLIP